MQHYEFLTLFAVVTVAELLDFLCIRISYTNFFVQLLRFLSARMFSELCSFWCEIKILELTLGFFAEKDYTSICEQQPIGAQQFRDFCSTKPTLKTCIEFQEKIVSFVTAASTLQFHMLILC